MAKLYAARIREGKMQLKDVPVRWYMEVLKLLEE